MAHVDQYILLREIIAKVENNRTTGLQRHSELYIVKTLKINKNPIKHHKNAFFLLFLKDSHNSKQD